MVISESPVEQRFGVPVLPADAYELAFCRGCGSLYVDCDVADEYLAKLYRSESVAWQKTFLERGGAAEAIGDSRVPEFQAHWRQMTRVRAAQRGEALLDFGCQTGEFGSVAMHDGIVPNGIELSPDYAHKAHSAWGAQSTVLSDPLSADSFTGRKFHYVTAFETLEHLPDPRACLKQLRGLIEGDGLLALSVPSTHYFWLKFKIVRALRARPWLLRTLLGRRAALYQSQILPHTHLYNFSPRAVDLLLRQAGFQSVSRQAVGWSGRSALLSLVCKMIMNVTGQRIAMAPSVFAIARPA